MGITWKVEGDPLNKWAEWETGWHDLTCENCAASAGRRKRKYPIIT